MIYSFVPSSFLSFHIYIYLLIYLFIYLFIFSFPTFNHYGTTLSLLLCLTQQGILTIGLYTCVQQSVSYVSCWARRVKNTNGGVIGLLLFLFFSLLSIPVWFPFSDVHVHNTWGFLLSRAGPSGILFASFFFTCSPTRASILSSFLFFLKTGSGISLCT